MARLRKEVDVSLKKTFKRVYGALDQATDQVEALRSDILIPHLQLDSFRVVQEGALVEDVGAASEDEET